MKLLGVEIVNKLSFEKHFPTLGKRASNKLNTISRIQKFMGFKGEKDFLNSFVYSNFNYCPCVAFSFIKISNKDREKNARTSSQNTLQQLFQ